MLTGCKIIQIHLKSVTYLNYKTNIEILETLHLFYISNSSSLNSHILPHFKVTSFLSLTQIFPFSILDIFMVSMENLICHKKYFADILQIKLFFNIFSIMMKIVKVACVRLKRAGNAEKN